VNILIEDVLVVLDWFFVKWAEEKLI
jgi:hypothetical protein